ncbi:acyl carrier protein [Nocardia higoensis]|uniref:Acyl carrier protein n=1 Tax=Nocardia higoensis TaxID=228599 RepID=A0ABS0D7K0_9NOCA|nr:acyl carrier protein [Nocardia higoensis]MBF6354450.1 acyl carrier protein [Nocardia higoensis]
MNGPAVSGPQAEAIVRAALRGFAEESRLRELAPDDPLREVLELDSIDYLTFVERISDAVGARIDEDDYPSVATIRSWSELVTSLQI